MRTTKKVWRCGTTSEEPMYTTLFTNGESSNCIIVCYSSRRDQSEEKEYTLSQAERLFGYHIVKFVKALRNSPHSKLYSYKARRIGLLASYGDKNRYEDDEAPVDIDWVIQYVWLSSGGRGEIEGAYYGQGVNESHGHHIDLYIFQQ